MTTPRFLGFFYSFHDRCLSVFLHELSAWRAKVVRERRRRMKRRVCLPLMMVFVLRRGHITLEHGVHEKLFRRKAINPENVKINTCDGNSVFNVLT